MITTSETYIEKQKQKALKEGFGYTHVYSKYLSDSPTLLDFTIKHLSNGESLLWHSDCGSGKSSTVTGYNGSIGLAQRFNELTDMPVYIAYPTTAIVEDKRESVNPDIVKTTSGISDSTMKVLRDNKIVQCTIDSLAEAFNNGAIDRPCLIILDENSLVSMYASFKNKVIVSMYDFIKENKAKGGACLSMDATPFLAQDMSFKVIKTTRVDSLGRAINNNTDVDFYSTKQHSKTIINDLVGDIDKNTKELHVFRVSSYKVINEVTPLLEAKGLKYAVLCSKDEEMIRNNKRYIESANIGEVSEEDKNKAIRDVLNSLIAGNIGDDCQVLIMTSKGDVGVSLRTKKKVNFHIVCELNRGIVPVTAIRQICERRRKQDDEDKNNITVKVYGSFGNEEPNKNVAQDIEYYNSTDRTEKALDELSKELNNSAYWNYEDYRDSVANYGINLKSPLKYVCKREIKTNDNKISSLIYYYASADTFDKIKAEVYREKGLDIEDYIPSEYTANPKGHILTNTQHHILSKFLRALADLIISNINPSFMFKEGKIRVTTAEKVAFIGLSLNNKYKSSDIAEERILKEAQELISEWLESGKVIKSELNSLVSDKHKDKYVKIISRYLEEVYNIKQGAFTKNKSRDYVRISKDNRESLRKQRNTPENEAKISASKDVSQSEEHQYTIFSKSTLECSENELKNQVNNNQSLRLTQIQAFRL